MHKNIALAPFLILFPLGGVIIHISIAFGVGLITASKNNFQIALTKTEWLAFIMGLSAALINLNIKIIYLLLISALILILRVEINQKIANAVFYLYSTIFILLRTFSSDYQIGLLNNHVVRAFLYFYLFLFAEKNYLNIFILIITTLLFGSRTALLCVVLYTLLSFVRKKNQFLINILAFVAVFIIQANSYLILDIVNFGSHYRTDLGRVTDFQDSSAEIRLQQYNFFLNK